MEKDNFGKSGCFFASKINQTISLDYQLLNFTTSACDKDGTMTLTAFPNLGHYIALVAGAEVTVTADNTNLVIAGQAKVSMY